MFVLYWILFWIFCTFLSIVLIGVISGEDCTAKDALFALALGPILVVLILVFLSAEGVFDLANALARFILKMRRS